MENVLAAIIVIFLILFAGLTLTQAFITSQDTIRTSWQEMQARQDEQSRTHLAPVETHTSELGNTIHVALHNTGSTRLADFQDWDVIVQYAGATNADRRAYYRGYAAGEWAQTIYLDAVEAIADVHEPSILNPGEEVSLQIQAPAIVGQGEVIQVIVGTQYGPGASALVTGNWWPVLHTRPLVVDCVGCANAAAPLTPDVLQITDADEPLPDELIYKLEALPLNGTLSRQSGAGMEPLAVDDSFTQAEIDSGAIVYTHTQPGADSFQFSISDGRDTLAGNFLTIITRPSLAPIPAAPGYTANSTPVPIDATWLQASDEDDPDPAHVVYTVTTPPTSGMLSGATFTQAQIAGGALTYAGIGPDSFEFTITDADGNVIGPFPFEIAAGEG